MLLDSDVEHWEADDWDSKGWECQNDGDWEDARECFDRAFKLNPLDWWSLRRL